MSPYFKKQLIISFVYLTIFAAIVGGAYFIFRSPATCFDQKQNQDEEGVDCGGPCSTCQEASLAPRVLWAKAFLVEENSYDLAAEIENKNVNYGAEILSYTFKIFDSRNNIIKEKSGKSYIMPREKKYIIETVSLSGIPAKVVLEFSKEINWQKFKSVEELKLPIFQQNLDTKSKNGYAAIARGTVYNQTRFDLDTIDINIVVYDKKGNPVGVNRTQKNTVKSGEGRSFEVGWPKSLSGTDELKAEMRAYTNIFSDDNFIRSFLER